MIRMSNEKSPLSNVYDPPKCFGGKKNHLFLCLNNLDKYIVWWTYGSNEADLSGFFFSLGLER